jgi:hypothetical protein
MVHGAAQHRDGRSGRLARWVRHGLMTLGGTGAAVLVSAGFATSAAADDGETLLRGVTSAVTETVDDAAAPVVREVASPVGSVATEAVRPAVRAVAEPVVQGATEPVAEEVLAPVVHSTAAATVEKVVAPVVRDVAEPVKQVTEPVKQVTEPVVGAAAPLVQPVLQDVVEPLAEGGVAPVVEPVADGVVAPLVGAIVTPVVDGVLDPAVDAVVAPVPGGVLDPVGDVAVVPAVVPGVEPDLGHATGPSEPLARDLAVATRQNTPAGRATPHASSGAPSGPLLATLPGPAASVASAGNHPSGGTDTDLAGRFAAPLNDLGLCPGAVPPSASLDVLLEVAVAPD